MNRDPLRPLGDDAVARYRADGAVCLRGMFDADWIAKLAEDVDADIAAPGPMKRINTPEGNPGRFFVDFQLWRRWPHCRAFALASPGAAIAARMTGSAAINYYHDHLLVKEPGTIEPTPWHHDQPYYPVDGDEIVSIWLPLDPVARDTCVEYVKGSHRWGRRFQPRFFKQTRDAALKVADTRLEPVPDIDGNRGDYELLGWDMELGDCIVFHGLTVHGAPGNKSATRRRRAYSTRWLGADTRYAKRDGQISPPIDGHGLKPGDKMECALFPRVWPR